MPKGNEDVEDELGDEPEDSDTTDWKSEAQKLREKAIAQRERTKVLKARITELEKPKEPEKKPDDGLLKRLDALALKVSGITADDEVELFNKWKTDTGRGADDIVGNSIFKQELEGLRTAKANQVATSDIRGEHGESGVKNTPDYWLAKATKGPDGNLLFPEETPKEMYSKILSKLSANEPGNSEELKFHNSK